MYFSGQKLNEKIFKILIVLSTLIGFIIGAINQKFSHTCKN